MAAMKDAIASTIITELKTALAAYYPATPPTIVDEYIGERFDPGDPPAMTKQWYASVHGINSQEQNRIPGQPYTSRRWSCLITVTVLSSYAPDSRITNPMTLYQQIVDAAQGRLSDRPWDILAAINTAFGSAVTNGLTEPFIVNTPMPQRQKRDPSWLKAISHKKTSQISCFSGTIRLSDALHIQPIGNTA